MTAQTRPLSGMLDVNGNATPFAITVAPVLVHQLDLLSSQLGGPYPDNVTLLVQNPTAADLDVTVTMPLAGSHVAITQTIKSKVAAAIVLAAQPIGVTNGTPFANAQITAQGSGVGLIAWGFFTRPV